MSSSAGAIIRWYLANGFTIAQIRAMFPAWFLSTPLPGG